MVMPVNAPRISFSVAIQFSISQVLLLIQVHVDVVIPNVIEKRWDLTLYYFMADRDSIAPPEDHRQPAEAIKDFLRQADRGIPRKRLELPGEKENIPTEKSFKPQETLLTINRLAEDFGETPEAKQQILGKFATLLDLTVGKFSWQGKDRVDLGLLDQFLSQFPGKIQEALLDKSNQADWLNVILDIGISSAGAINHESAVADMYPNYELTRTCRALSNLADYASGGGFDESAEKQKLLHRLADNSRQNVAEAAKMLLESKTAGDGFDNKTSAVRNLGEFTLTVFESDPQLLSRLGRKSIRALAEAGKNLKEATPGDRLTLIREAGQIIAGLKNGGEVATHFCETALTSLAEEINRRGYGMIEARRYLDQAVKFFRAANTNKNQDSDAYHNSAGFLNEGYLGILLSVGDEEFINRETEFVNGEGSVTSRLKRTMNGLDMLETVRLLAVASEKSLTPAESVEFYQQVLAQKQLPVHFAARDVREAVSVRLAAGPLPENIKDLDLRQPLLAVIQACQGMEYDDLDVVGSGLSAAFFNDQFTDFTLSQIGRIEPDNFAGFIKGLGAMNEAWFKTKFFAEKKMSAFLEIPATEVGQAGLVLAMNNLAEIYFKASEAWRQQFNQLAVYTMEHDELRTAFLLHLHQDTDAQTLTGLSWITRLSGANEQLGQTVRGFLGQRMEGLALPAGQTENGETAPETAMVLSGSNGVAIERVVNHGQPLGMAIQVISEAVDHDPATMHSVAEALGKVKLRTVEDAQAIAMPIINAISKFLGIDRQVLLDNMFEFRKTSGLVDQISERSKIGGFIAGVMSVMGGGPIPVLSFNLQENAIYINEEYADGWTVDGLGEEIAHWVRDTLHPNGEDNMRRLRYIGNTSRVE